MTGEKKERRIIHHRHSGSKRNRVYCPTRSSKLWNGLLTVKLYVSLLLTANIQTLPAQSLSAVHSLVKMVVLGREVIRHCGLAALDGFAAGRHRGMSAMFSDAYQREVRPTARRVSMNTPLCRRLIGMPSYAGALCNRMLRTSSCQSLALTHLRNS